MEAKILEWNGSELPSLLRDLPPGRYLIEPLDEDVVLSEEEEAGLLSAIEELDAGGGHPIGEVLARVRAGLPQP
jgi:hypothetical protein